MRDIIEGKYRGEEGDKSGNRNYQNSFENVVNLVRYNHKVSFHFE